MKKLLIIIAGFLFALISVFSSVAASKPIVISKSSLTVKTSSDKSLYWGFSGKEFANSYNSIADKDYKIKNAASTSEKYNLSKSCEITIKTTADGYVSKISVKISEKSFDSLDAELLSNTMYFILNVLNRGDLDSISQILDSISAEQMKGDAGKGFDGIVVSNKIKYTLTTTFGNDNNVIEFSASPTLSKDTI